jgi:hypothetical protein
MSTISAPLTDSRIMLRRNFKHIRGWRVVACWPEFPGQ